MNKYANNEIMKVIGISGIYRAIFHNGSYLFLFETRKLQSCRN